MAYEWKKKQSNGREEGSDQPPPSGDGSDFFSQRRARLKREEADRTRLRTAAKEDPPVVEEAGSGSPTDDHTDESDAGESTRETSPAVVALAFPSADAGPLEKKEVPVAPPTSVDVEPPVPVTKDLSPVGSEKLSPEDSAKIIGQAKELYIQVWRHTEALIKALSKDDVARARGFMPERFAYVEEVRGLEGFSILTKEQAEYLRLRIRQLEIRRDELVGEREEVVETAATKEKEKKVDFLISQARQRQGAADEIMTDIINIADQLGGEEAEKKEKRLVNQKNILTDIDKKLDKILAGKNVTEELEKYVEHLTDKMLRSLKDKKWKLQEELNEKIMAVAGSLQGVGGVEEPSAGPEPEKGQEEELPPEQAEMKAILEEIEKLQPKVFELIEHIYGLCRAMGGERFNRAEEIVAERKIYMDMGFDDGTLPADFSETFKKEALEKIRDALAGGVLVYEQEHADLSALWEKKHGQGGGDSGKQDRISMPKEREGIYSAARTARWYMSREKTAVRKAQYTILWRRLNEQLVIFDQIQLKKDFLELLNKEHEYAQVMVQQQGFRGSIDDFVEQREEEIRELEGEYYRREEEVIKIGETLKPKIKKKEKKKKKKKP